MVTLCCRCVLDGKYQQAMGMAVECRRLDKLEEAIVRCDNINGALSYCINLSHQYVSHREYRCEVRACYTKLSLKKLSDSLIVLLNGNASIMLVLDTFFACNNYC